MNNKEYKTLKQNLAKFLNFRVKERKNIQREKANHKERTILADCSLLIKRRCQETAEQ